MNILQRMGVSFALTLAIILAPVLPAFASAAADAATPALHANHGKTDGVTVHADQKPGSCIQDSSCNGECCVTCVQCAGAAFDLSAPFVLTRAVQFPAAVPRLHDRLMAAAHDRPPAV